MEGGVDISPAMQWLVAQGGLGLTVAILLRWHMERQRDMESRYEDALRRERENAEQHREDKLRVAESLDRATAASVQLAGAIGELTRASDELRSELRVSHRQGGD